MVTYVESIREILNITDFAFGEIEATECEEPGYLGAISKAHPKTKIPDQSKEGDEEELAAQPAFTRRSNRKEDPLRRAHTSENEYRDNRDVELGKSRLYRAKMRGRIIRTRKEEVARRLTNFFPR